MIPKGHKKHKHKHKHKMSVKRCGERCQTVATIAKDSVVGSPKIKAGAYVLIAQMQGACQQCCQGKGFYENCVKPIKNFLSNGIKPHNDPAFDGLEDHINKPRIDGHTRPAKPYNGILNDRPHEKPLPPKKTKPTVNENRIPSWGPYDSQGTRYYRGAP